MGLNPETATFCDFLDADDRASFPGARNKAVVIIGLDPAILDFSSPEFAAFPGINAAKIMAGLTSSQKQLAAMGYDVDVCLIDYGATAVAVATAHLKQKKYDCVMIGAGIRALPSTFLLFEKLINVVHEHAPMAKICFNTNPADTTEAVQRWV